MHTEGNIIGRVDWPFSLETDYLANVGVAGIMTSLDISDARFGMTSVGPIPVHRQLLAIASFNLRQEILY